jgi:hypothetical protein
MTRCWRQLLDMRENYFYDIAPVRTPRRDKGKKRPDLAPNLGSGRAGISRRLGAGRAIWPGAVHELDRALVADRAVGTLLVIVPTPSLAF